jgi:hypothetical protein
MNQSTAHPTLSLPARANAPFTMPSSAFARRVQTWETLVAGSYHLCWHPQFIDAALNKVPAATSIEQIVGSKRFLSACARLNRYKTSVQQPLAVSSTVLREANREPRQPLLDMFLGSQISRAMSNFNINAFGASSREDAYELLRYQYIVNAGKFKPGSQVADDRFRTFGYSAFHRSFIRAAWNGIVKQGFHRCESLDTTADAVESAGQTCLTAVPEEACVAPQSAGVYDVQMCLPAALRYALSDSVAWDVFYGHVYRGSKLDELVPHLKVSPAFLSVRITSQIMKRLGEYFGAAEAEVEATRPKITDLRDLLDSVLSERDFVKLVPRPTDDQTSRRRVRLPEPTIDSKKRVALSALDGPLPRMVTRRSRNIL